MSSFKSLAALLVACCAVLFPASPAHASTHEVMIHNYAYSPASLVVAPGDTVTWTNMDTAQHDVSVTKGPTTFKSPLLAQGKSWSYTFTTAGSYSYICSVHPDMKASVVVLAPAPSTPKATATVAAPASGSHTHAAAPSPATPKPVATTAPAVVTPTAQAAARATTPMATTVTETSQATLSPLLIVLGLSAAVMVFCLLLMVSRPQTVAVRADEPDDG